MKRKFAGLLTAALMTVPMLTACGGSGGNTDAICKADADFDPSDPAAAVEAIDKMKADAPADIKDDLEVLSEQLKLAQSDPTKMDVDAVGKASDALIKWSAENCKS